MTPLRCLALAGLLVASTAHAQAPRAGRALSLDRAGPGVWVSPRRMWMTPSEALPLSACARSCAPVVAHESCTVPSCPGDGVVVIVERDVAAVPDYPRDYDGYQRELEALRSDATLAPLHPYLREHPEHSAREAARQRAESAAERERRRREESVRWVSNHRDGDRLELSIAATAATLGELGGGYLGASAAAAFVHLARANRSEDDDGDDTLFNFLIGDQLGAELRAHFLYRTGDGPEWMTLVGVGSAFANRFERSVVRLPTIVGLMIPELGIALRSDRDPTWYASWSAPFSILLAHDVAFDAAARVFIVDDWIAERANEDGTTTDPVEAIFMLSLGLRLP